MLFLSAFNDLIKSVEQRDEGTSEASGHQRQSCEGVSHLICRANGFQEPLGRSLTKEEKNRANIFREPLGRLLEQGGEQVGERDDLRFALEVMELGDQEAITCRSHS